VNSYEKRASSGAAMKKQMKQDDGGDRGRRRLVKVRRWMKRMHEKGDR